MDPDDPGSDAPTPPGGSAGDDCSDAAKLIYALTPFKDQGDSVLLNELVAFDPRTKMFTEKGMVECSGQNGAWISMSVDRTGTAWLLDVSSHLFRLDVVTAECTLAGSLGLGEFIGWDASIGFSTDSSGGTAESLFLVSNEKIAKIDLQTASHTPIGALESFVELTGTGDGKLWGLFAAKEPAQIQQIDKTSGAVLKTFDVAELPEYSLDYAFAFWGGDFWLFEAGFNTETEMGTVYQVDGTTGAIRSTMQSPYLELVGAGVSTCAPVVLL